ncbi:hypothetical protein GW17_00054198 [Ensete ventricosum]|nr:hypothetical protein GW17_00054198 [Ensete ventricosum]
MAAHANVSRGLVVVLALVVCLSCAAAEGGGSVRTVRQRLEVRRHLKRLNKKPVKSIRMRPTYHPEGLFDENKVASQKKKTPSTAQLWHQNGRCPEDTIPIRRTTRDDVLRATSVKRYGRKKHRSIPCPLSVDPDLLNESGHQFGNDYVLGYWPSFLFSYLADSASMIEWGGEVVNSDADGEHTSTEMGSGRFPEEGFGKASYFRNIQVVDGSNNLRAPTGVGAFTEQSNCYDVQNGNNGEWGQYFYYGGPGRNSNCP